jgi:hypothetical protein
MTKQITKQAPDTTTAPPVVPSGPGRFAGTDVAAVVAVVLAIILGVVAVTPFRPAAEDPVAPSAEDPVAPPAIPAELADVAVLDSWHRQHLLNQQPRISSAEDWAVLDSWHRQHLLNQQRRAEAGED